MLEGRKAWRCKVEIGLENIISKKQKTDSANKLKTEEGIVLRMIPLLAKKHLLL